MSEGLWHRASQRLRYSDNDAVGHVNNAIYATMFEAGRTELMDAAGIFVRGGPLAGVIVRLEIDFKREMSWPGDVVIESGVARFGTKSVHIRHRLLFKDEIVAEGLAILALIDRETRRAVPLDDNVRAKFAPWTLPAG
jgi:acyl-CoA thioester hydrolase